MYTIIRKRQVFHSLANLPVDGGSIGRCLNRKVKIDSPEPMPEENLPETPSMEGSKPAQPAEPGTLKATLLETPGEILGKKIMSRNQIYLNRFVENLCPGVMKMTERESAHPGSCDIPAELVTGNNDEKSKSINEISVPKKIPISNRLSRVNLTFYDCVRDFSNLQTHYTLGR